MVAAAGYTGFAAGAVTGGMSGAAAGALNGFGFSLLDGNSASDAINDAVARAISGMAIGAIVGGVAEELWPSRPPKHPNVQESAEKGRVGEIKAETMVYEQGGEVTGRQVTIRVDGTDVRLDMVAEFDGQKVLIEVKNGPYAGYTHNQSIVYPKLASPLPELPTGMSIPDFLALQRSVQPGTPITPIGPRATAVWGSQDYITNYTFIIIRF